MPDHTIEPYIPVDFDFACGCHLSIHDEDRYCEDHTHIAVQREGASLRTGDELLIQLLNDAASIKFPGLPVTYPEWDVCLERCNEDFLANEAGSYCHWLSNDDLREELEDLAKDAESKLGEEGWSIDWDDGYRIWRPTGDNPVAEMRHMREVDG